MDYIYPMKIFIYRSSAQDRLCALVIRGQSLNITMEYNMKQINLNIKIRHLFSVLSPLNNRSVRDCSGNPASRHILLFLCIYYKYTQWCNADWSEKPDPTPPEVGETPNRMHQSSQIRTIHTVL